MAWSADDLMLSKKDFTLHLEPFPYFTIENFLPDDLYDALLAAWPEEGLVDRQLAEGKFNRSLDEETVAGLPDCFKFIFSVFSSQAFVDDYFQALKTGFQRACTPLPISGFRISGEPKRSAFERQIEFAGQFSRLEDGAFLSPHTDKFTKWLSLLLYFPPPDWKEEYGGQTVLYEAENPRHSRNWSNRHLPFEQVREVARSIYKPNAIFGFIKAPNSWHGVLPINAPASVARHSINLNYQTAKSVQSGVPYRLLEGFHRRSEAYRFRDVPDMKEENRRMRDERIRALAADGLAPAELAHRFSTSLNDVENVLGRK